MPLVPRYSWEQDAQQLVLEVYLPGTALRTTDIYGTAPLTLHRLPCSAVSFCALICSCWRV